MRKIFISSFLLAVLFIAVGAGRPIISVHASEKLISGDRVQTTAALNVRADSNTSATILGTELTGALGTISGTVRASDGFNWWFVTYDNGIAGFSVENYLQKTTMVAPTSSAIDTIPPSTPVGLVKASFDSTNHLSLSWSPSTDNVGVVGYKVFLLGSFLASTTQSEIAGIYVPAGSTYPYLFEVQAYDAAGNLSGFSARFSFTAPAVSPPPFPPPPVLTPAPTPLGPAVKVMMLGDSITAATCYVPFLFVDLKNGGYTNISFVGSAQMADAMFGLAGAGITCAYVPYYSPPLTEGHSGWTSHSIATSLPGWLSQATPDIVVMHVGTNDLWNATSITAPGIVDVTLANYSNMVASMRASNPNIKIIVDQIIPHSYSTDSLLASGLLDDAIPAWAAPLTTTRSPIYVVDLRTGFDTKNFYSDGRVHPDETGAKFMADRVYPTLTAAANKTPPSSTDTTPPSTPTSLIKTGLDSTNNLTLSWSPSTDNVGVTGYNVRVWGTLYASTTQTSLSGIPVQAGTTYPFTVQGYDAAGNLSGQSAVFSFTAPATVQNKR